jgi:hypothetical protein
VQCISKVLGFRNCSQMTIPDSLIDIQFGLPYAMLQPGHRPLRRRRRTRSSAARTRSSARSRRSCWPLDPMQIRLHCPPGSGAAADVGVGDAPVRSWHVEGGGGGAGVVDGSTPGVVGGAVRAGAAGVPESTPSDAEREADSPAAAAGRSTPGSAPAPGAEKSP